MFRTLKHLLTDNPLRKLMSGGLTLPEDLINSFIARSPMPPMLNSARIECGDGFVFIEAEGAVSGARFRFRGGAAVKELTVTKAKQAAALVPRGPLEFRSDNIGLRVDFTDDRGVVEDLESFASLLPPEVSGALEFGPGEVRVLPHRLPGFSSILEERMTSLPVLKEIGVNPLDHIEITGVEFERGSMRILTRRKKSEKDSGA